MLVALAVAVGLVADTLYGKWRKSKRPSAPKRVAFGQPSIVIINSRALVVMPGSDIVLSSPGVPWRADLVLRLDRGGCEHVAAVSRERADLAVLFDQIKREGSAKPERLQFFDDPNQRGVRFARFSFVGVGELEEVRDV
jgi:hypothetical protein